MDAQAAYERRSDHVFVDVREPFEWDAGHLDDSLHIPLMQLPDRFDEIPKGKPVVVVCQVGQRSEIAARFLRQQGYDAHNLAGGLSDWSARGLPL